MYSLWIFELQNWTFMCIVNILPKFQMNMKLGSCPKNLWFITMSGFAFYFCWNLQFRTLPKIVHNAQIYWYEYWLEYYCFLKKEIKILTFLSLLCLVLAILKVNNWQLLTFSKSSPEGFSTKMAHMIWSVGNSSTITCTTIASNTGDYYT